jgi:hypothetical protein
VSWTQSDFKSVDDTAGNVVLDRKDIGQIAVIAVSPQVSAIGGVDKLRRNPDAIAGAAGILGTGVILTTMRRRNIRRKRWRF